MLSQHPNPPSPTTLGVVGPFEYRVAPSAASIRLARHALGHWLHLQPGADLDAVDDLLIACSELFTNAVEHACGADSMVAVRGRIEGTSVVLEIENDGPGFVRPPERRMIDVPDDDEHGRGLFIVDVLTDRVEVEAAGGHTIVRCVKDRVIRQPASHDHESDGLSNRFQAGDNGP
jgi:serine/threonine-protein kinase RsbW